MADAIRTMTVSDLDQVLSWRNDPRVRTYMLSHHEISREEHLAWFQRASSDPSRHLLIYEHDGAPSGFMNLTLPVPDVPIADWGFYAAPDAPAGTGTGMGREALKYAFVRLSLHKVCGQVLAFNERSIRFHRRLGFVEEGRLRQQHFDGERFVDLIWFGLLSGEWTASSGGVS